MPAMKERVSSPGQTLVRHVAIAATTGWIVGAVDGFFSARGADSSPWLGALFGAGLLALVGGIVGLVQGLVIRVGHRLLARRGIVDRWRAMTSPDRADDREPVIDLHARIIVATLVGGTLVLGFAVFLQASATIKEPSLRDVVLVMSVAGVLAVMAVGAAMLMPLARRLLTRVDATIGLPFPKWQLLRYVIFVAAPTGAALIPLYVIYGVKLGVLSTVFAVILFAVAEGLVWRLRCAIPARVLESGSRRHRFSVAALGTLLVATLVISVATFERWSSAATVAREASVLPWAVEVLQTVSDVDRDGISSLFGGNDCAPFDGDRSPAAREIAGNGIDEDCDGVDLADVHTKLAPYLDTLTKKQKKRFNVLLLVIDSLRADHVSAYGYKKKTTPFLDELATSAWMFTRAYSQSSTTSLSMPSMHSGLRPGSMKWRIGYPQPAHPERLLPAILRRHGYETTLAINRYVFRHLRGLKQAFQHVRTVPKGTDWKSGEYIISDIISAVEAAKQAKRPFFVTAHFDDVHHPYRAFMGRSVPRFPNSDRNIANYDRCIANMDNMLRPLVSHLRHTGVWDDTIVIITSDHGEEFGEHGETIHSRSCYIESVHVPLLVRIPGFAPARIEQRVALVDIVPTLIEVLDLPRDNIALDGQSLFVASLAPERVTKERPIFCSIFQLLRGRRNFFTRSVRTASHTLIQEALSDNLELFDNTEDPRETTNIASSNKDTVGALRDTLKASLSGNLWEARRFK